MKLIRCDYDDNGNITGVTINNNGQDVRFEPVRRGEWEAENKKSAFYNLFVSCSRCGALLDTKKAHYYPFCYNCGAKMGGEAENGQAD